MAEIENTWHIFLDFLCASLHGSIEGTVPMGTVPVGSKSERTVPVGSCNWQELFSLASRHHVLPLVADAACRCPECADIPPSLFEEVQSQTLQVYVQQAVRTQAFLEIYKSLRNMGLQPIVLKGLICRALYPDPNQRPSTDEDILIPQEQFEAAHKALLSLGLECERRVPDTSIHEITYTNPHLRIELHLSFFPEESDAYGELNLLFDGALKRALEVEIDTQSGKILDSDERIHGDSIFVWTLSPKDHLLFLLCHAYKHFLHSGVGVRQVCDIGMFSKKYEDQIDWGYVWGNCEKVRMTKFAAGLFRIASGYLGFAMPAAFTDVDVDETDLLRDMLSGGIYGAIEENRQHSATITLGAVAAQRRMHGYTRVWASLHGLFRSIFLPLRSMNNKYLYLNELPWLLPAAWVQRVVQYLFHSGSGTTANAAESLRIGNRRVELLQEYGIID